MTFPVCRRRSINALKTSICGASKGLLRLGIGKKIPHWSIAESTASNISSRKTYLNIFFPFLETVNQLRTGLHHQTTSLIKLCQTSKHNFLGGVHTILQRKSSNKDLNLGTTSNVWTFQTCIYIRQSLLHSKRYREHHIWADLCIWTVFVTHGPVIALQRWITKRSYFFIKGSKHLRPRENHSWQALGCSPSHFPAYILIITVLICTFSALATSKKRCNKEQKKMNKQDVLWKKTCRVFHIAMQQLIHSNTPE